MNRIQGIVAASIIGIGTLGASVCSAATITYGGGKLTPEEENFAKNVLLPNTTALIYGTVYVASQPAYYYKKVYYKRPYYKKVYYTRPYYKKVYYGPPVTVINVNPGYVGWGRPYYYDRYYYKRYPGHYYRYY